MLNERTNMDSVPFHIFPPVIAHFTFKDGMNGGIRGRVPKTLFKKATNAAEAPQIKILVVISS